MEEGEAGEQTHKGTGVRKERRQKFCIVFSSAFAFFSPHNTTVRRKRSFFKSQTDRQRVGTVKNFFGRNQFYGAYRAKFFIFCHPLLLFVFSMRRKKDLHKINKKNEQQQTLPWVPTVDAFRKFTRILFRCSALSEGSTQTHSSQGVILESRSLHTSPSTRAACFLKSALQKLSSKHIRVFCEGFKAALCHKRVLSPFYRTGN